MSKLKKTAQKTGRPTKRTPEVVERILNGLSDGIPLTHICKEPGMPHPNKVREWMTKDQDLSGAIACAREVGADAIAEDALRIADTPLKGITTKVTPDGTHITEEDMLGHRRLQVETRLKLLAKWNPKKYGDKIETQHSGSVDVVIIGGPNSTVDHPDAR